MGRKTVLLIFILLFFIYKKLTIQQLHKWNHIPLYWWILLVIPLLIILIYAGTKLRSFKEIPILSIPFALTIQGYYYFASLLKEPGFLKSPEHPNFWKPILFFVNIIIISFILAWILILVLG